MEYILPFTKNDVLNVFRKTKALLIDFDGTLVDYKKAADKALERLFQMHKLPNEVLEAGKNDYEKINTSLWREFEKMKEIYALEDSPKEVDEEYLSYLIENTTLDPKSLSLLKKVKNRGIDLFIVSNGIHYVQEQRIKKTDLLEVVDGYVTSEQVGKPKPHKQIFIHALDKLQVTKEQAFMIGDSYEADIVGSYNVGIKSCLIKKSIEMPRWIDDKKPIIVTNNFNEFMYFYLKMQE
jgi:putative hydrolase of the HAD superfamily